MLDALYAGIYWAHVPTALACVPAFWTAALSRKGGPLHVRVGRLFGWGMRFVALSGMVMALLVLLEPHVNRRSVAHATEADRAAFEEARRVFGLFLLYLGVITFFPVHHGVRVIRTRRAPATLATPLHRLLALLPLLASVGAVAAALLVGGSQSLLLLAMSPIGVVETVLARRYLALAPDASRPWRVQHLVFLFIGGIAAHTAFAVFFLGGVLGLRLPGPLAVLPWLLPTLVGVPAIAIAVRRETR